MNNINESLFIYQYPYWIIKFIPTVMHREHKAKGL